MHNVITIPQPLVRLNQSMIAISSVTYLITGASWILIFPILTGFTSLVFDYNPLMKLGKQFLKKPVNEYIQEDKTQQRFNQILALTMLLVAFVSNGLNLFIVSYIFAFMVFIASTVALMGFCIGCFIHYQYHMWKYRKSLLEV